jgi:spore cortex biosynthesis protein YabQ
MNLGIITELRFFIISVLWGALVLLAYDILRILRRIIRHNEVVVAIQDIIFWIIASIFIFAMIYIKNDGIIRGFSVMGMTIGMVAYHYILSDMIVMLVSRLILLVLRPFYVAMGFILKGLKVLGNKIKTLTNKIYGRLKSRAKSVKISIKNSRQKRKSKADLKRKKRSAKKKHQKRKKQKAKKPKAKPIT